MCPCQKVLNVIKNVAKPTKAFRTLLDKRQLLKISNRYGWLSF